MKIKAKDYSDLERKLTKYTVSVAERGKKRTTEQTEDWVSKRLLPTLAKARFLEFPVSIVRDDRPDLRVEMPTHSAGIEITEVVPQVYAQAVAIKNEDYPDAIVNRSIFTWGAQFTAKDIHKHLSKVGDELTGPGWKSDSVEQEWASAVNERIINKTGKLNKQGFTIYPNNWLAVYTSSPGPQLNIQRAGALLTSPASNANEHRFDVIFALTDSKFVVLTDDDFFCQNLVVI
jgi:hypothetical protein